ncbi:hypothetical protein GCM10007199_35200 [Fictibacillus barbaricus]|nr:hypothetical protein GCM10007199_35200 [Fictibacillus barbaricus]
MSLSSFLTSLPALGVESNVAAAVTTVPSAKPTIMDFDFDILKFLLILLLSNKFVNIFYNPMKNNDEYKNISR